MIGANITANIDERCVDLHQEKNVESATREENQFITHLKLSIGLTTAFMKQSDRWRLVASSAALRASDSAHRRSPARRMVRPELLLLSKTARNI